MDRPLSKNQKRKATLKLLYKTLIIAIVPIVLLFSLRNIFSPVLKYDMIQTAIAEQGDISITVSGAGVVIPNYEELIVAPFRTKILIINNQPGDEITIGDTLMILDNEIAVNELNRLRNEMELMIIRKERQETELIQIIEDFVISKEIKELRIKGLQSDYDNERKLNDMGGAPKENVIKAEADLKIAQLESKQAIVKHENNVGSRKSALREIETEIRIQQTLIKDADIAASQAYVRAPFDGVLSLINDNPGVMVNEGQEIARIADYSKYKLRGTVSNSWTGRVQTGQSVIIRDKPIRMMFSGYPMDPIIPTGDTKSCLCSGMGKLTGPKCFLVMLILITWKYSRDWRMEMK